MDKFQLNDELLGGMSATLGDYDWDASRSHSGGWDVMTSPGGPSAVEQAAAIDADQRTATSGQAVTVAAQQSYDVGPIWALLLPPLAALGLSMWNIATPSYWRDEAATMAAVKRPFGDMLSMLGNVDAVHGAYYVMMWPLAHMFGTGESVMRLPSALAAAVTAAFVAATGRRLVSPWAGLAAGLLFAVLPVASRYGQEARSYAMVMAVATIASYLLVRVFSAEPDGRRRWLAGYGASIAALGFMNIFGLLLLPAHAVTVALKFRRLRGSQDARRLTVGWLVAAVAGVVICSPVLLLGWQQRGQVAWIANNKTSGLSTLATLSGSALVTVVVAALIAIALVLSSEAGSARRVAWRWPLADLSLPWMLVPPGLLIGASVISPIYTARYVLICIPAAALLGGMAIVALGRIAGPVGLALVLLAGVTTQVAQRQLNGHGDNVRALDRVVAAHARRGDVVLYTNPNAESFSAAYSFGLGKLPDVAIKQAADKSGTLAGTSVDQSTLRARLSRASRVWVVEINRCLSEPQMLSLSAVPQGGPVLVGLPLHFVKIWHVRGDWLLLYKRGAGSQAITTACVGHTSRGR